MLNDGEPRDSVAAFNIEHSTLNIEHSDPLFDDAGVSR
jgi:hypothetical protein